MSMLAENKKELSLRKGGRGEIAEKMRNMNSLVFLFTLGLRILDIITRI